MRCVRLRSNDGSGLAPRRVFLSAQWRYLTMLNYEVDPGMLSQFVPAGTSLDAWNGKTYVSLVGFRFLATRVLGIAFPLHRDFDEVNLRLYVRRDHAGELRRGVVFVREIVPKFLIAAIARIVYNEHYIALPMGHDVALGLNGAPSITTEYRWRFGGRWQRLGAHAAGRVAQPQPGSLAQFITEHYWGYAKQRGGGTVEYEVTHEPWRLWSDAQGSYEGDSALLYGARFGEVLQRTPDSVCIAEGSPINVLRGTRIA